MSSYLDVTIPAVSAVSPVCIEGAAGALPDEDKPAPPATAKCNGGSLPAIPTSETRWFVDVPLNRDGSPTPVTIAQDATRLSKSGTVAWQPTDLQGAHSIVIRKGDALLLTAVGAGRALSLDANGDGMSEFAGAPGDKFPYCYDTPGVFTAKAWIDGACAGTLEVTVVSVDLRGPITTSIGYTRQKDVTVEPVSARAQVTFAPGEVAALSVSVEKDRPHGVQLNLTPAGVGIPVVLARLGGPGGPILAQQRIDGFKLTFGPGLDYVETLRDGTEVLVGKLVMTPLVEDPNIEFVVTTGSGGLTLEGGVTERHLNATEFMGSDDQTYGADFFLMLVPPGMTTHFHTIQCQDLDPGDEDGTVLAQADSDPGEKEPQPGDSSSGKKADPPGAVCPPVPPEFAAVFNRNSPLHERAAALAAIPASAGSPESLAASRWLLWQHDELVDLRCSLADTFLSWGEPHLIDDLIAMLADENEPPKWRTICVLLLLQSYGKTGRKGILDALFQASFAPEGAIVSSALWSLARAAASEDKKRAPGKDFIKRVGETCLAAMLDEKADMLVRVAGIQSCTLLKMPQTAAVCREIAALHDPKTLYLQFVAVASLGELGEQADVPLLKERAARSEKPGLAIGAAQTALKKVLARAEGKTLSSSPSPDREMMASWQPAPRSFPQAADEQATGPGASAGAGPPRAPQKTQPIHGPRMVFDSTDGDFGVVKAGQSAYAVYEFTNAGDETLHITGVYFGCCGCAEPHEYDKEVEPGKRGKLRVYVAPWPSDGGMRSQVTVASNDRQEPYFRLSIHGITVQQFEIKPPQIIFEPSGEMDKVLTGTLKITSRLEELVELTDLVCDNPAFSAEVVALEKGKVFELRVTVKPPYKAGRHSANITISTSSVERPKLITWATYRLQDRVEVWDREMFVPFPHGPLPKPLRRHVGLAHNVPGPLKITNIVVNGKNVTTKLTDQVDNGIQRYFIELTFEPGFVFPEYEGLKLTFNTDYPSTPSVEIPITNTPRRHKEDTPEQGVPKGS